MGILTDGKHWLLRWAGAGAINNSYPYSFKLESSQHWMPLYEWLRDKAIVSHVSLEPNQDKIEDYFGLNSPSYQRDIDSLRSLYHQYSEYETIKVKRGLWRDLLRTALGEVISENRIDDLFIRHTYLTAIVGMVVQATFNIDITLIAEQEPQDLLLGREFRNTTGVQGIIRNDFFTWPIEVGATSLLKTYAHRIAKFDWSNPPSNIAATLYETVIPPEERRRLGEYYTPQWLAKNIVQTVVTDPLNQRVLDPSCGSGTFLAEAVKHFLAQAQLKDIPSQQIFTKLRKAVTGIDIHPVAVHLARAAWTIAAKPAIETSPITTISAPVYLGDALQLRFRPGDMFAQHSVTISIEDEDNSQLIFPMSIVDRAETFDALMTDIAEHIENEEDPAIALDDHQIKSPNERKTLQETVGTLQRLHRDGRNHIWAYYTRNLVRPVALARNKVHVIIGNPPWINYNRTSSVLRTELEKQSKNMYGIWDGRRYASNQDVAGLFFTRCVDLYLQDKGIIGMVMPHSALQTGQYSKWRSGSWQSKNNNQNITVNFQYITAWDLEKLQPNTFFPVPASVIFAQLSNKDEPATPLEGNVERWVGKTGSDQIQRVLSSIIDTSIQGESPYEKRSREGASIYPRRLFFVTETPNVALVKLPNIIIVNPRRGVYDRQRWKNLGLARITRKAIEEDHVFDIHLGETVAPYTTLDPLRVVLPVKQSELRIHFDPKGVGGANIAALGHRMRQRWQIINAMWEDNKAPSNKLNLINQIDHYRKLSTQLQWLQNPKEMPIRVAYSAGGRPTATILPKRRSIIDTSLYWITCKHEQEAYYLLAIINSDILAELVNRYTTPNWAGNTRNLKKHLWKIPIPEFDPEYPLHTVISEAGKSAATSASEKLRQLQQQRNKVTVTIARRELRRWLNESTEGKTVEDTVKQLLC